MTGDAVEVSSDDDGFRDAWFEAKVARYMPKLHRYTVVYETIMDDADESRPLRETVDGRFVRPRPPFRHASGGHFALHQLVDAFYNDGWWVGVVSRVAEKGRQRRYSVAFPSTREEMEFAASQLRTHLEWVDGEWVLPESQVYLGCLTPCFIAMVSRWGDFKMAFSHFLVGFLGMLNCGLFIFIFLSPSFLFYSTLDLNQLLDVLYMLSLHQFK